MKKVAAIFLCFAFLLSLGACGGEEKEKKEKNDKEPKNRDVISVCLSAEPVTLDPALNSQVDSATMVSHLFSGLAKWAQDEKGNLAIVADSAEELPEGILNEDGTVTYTYTLKSGLKWSDGSEVTAEDYEFAWQRAASPGLNADCHYMFEIVDGYDAMWAKDDEGNFLYPDAKLNCRAIDKRTLEITLKSPVFYWNELLAFPAYFPVSNEACKNEGWASEADTYVSNGAYKMVSWAHGTKIVLEKNENYHGADKVTMQKIEFCLTDDREKMLSKFVEGEWALIDDVPVDKMSLVREEYSDEFVIAGRIGTYSISWNANKSLLPETATLGGDEAQRANAEIRRALRLIADRNYIAEEIGQAGQMPASSFVAMGMTDADGTQFYRNAGNSETFVGYYDVSKNAYEDNYKKALETLKKYYDWDGEKFTDFPPLTYLYNVSDQHRSVADYIVETFGKIGISVKTDEKEWDSFLAARAAGEYDIARNGWTADYNDPICFLDMWVTDSGNNDVQFGRGSHGSARIYSLDLTPYGYDIKVENGTWHETYDVLVTTVKSCSDHNKRYRLMHLAEDMLMETGCIDPLYFNTDIYMINENVKGFFSNPLGYKYFMYCTYKK